MHMTTTATTKVLGKVPLQSHSRLRPGSDAVVQPY